MHPTHGPYAAKAGITATPDGFIWLAARGAIIRMAPDGSYKVVLTGYIDPQSMTVGADGRVYAIGCCTRTGYFVVLAVTTNGVLSIYLPPSRDAINDAIVLGPDGNIWFSEQRHVAKLRPDGTITEYTVALPPGQTTNSAYGIGSVAGKIWFSINQDQVPPWHGFIVSVDPKNGKMTQTRVPCFDPGYITGAAGAVWGTCGVAYSTTAYVLQMTPAGVLSLYFVPDGYYGLGSNGLIAYGRNLWFVTYLTGPNPNHLTSFGLTTHQIVEYPIQNPAHWFLGGLVYSPDGHLWSNIFLQSSGFPAAGMFYKR